MLDMEVDQGLIHSSRIFGCAGNKTIRNLQGAPADCGWRPLLNMEEPVPLSYPCHENHCSMDLIFVVLNCVYEILLPRLFRRFQFASITDKFVPKSAVPASEQSLIV